MRRYALLGALALAAATPLAGRAGAQGISFSEGTPFAEVLRRARAEKKPVMLDAYAVWCGPCKQLDRTTFADATVGAWARKNVVAREVDAGVVIHEGQLTWKEEGFRLLGDLGALWKEETGLPLPLGGNAVRRDLGAVMIGKVSRALGRSIEYSLAHREEALTDAMRFARGLPREKADRFVGMYVNEWTRDYGEKGREAVCLLLDRAFACGAIPARVTPEWVGTE